MYYSSTKLPCAARGQKTVHRESHAVRYDGRKRSILAGTHEIGIAVPIQGFICALSLVSTSSSVQSTAALPTIFPMTSA